MFICDNIDLLCAYHMRIYFMSWQNMQNRIYLIERKMRRDVECRFSMFHFFRLHEDPFRGWTPILSHG